MVYAFLSQTSYKSGFDNLCRSTRLDYYNNFGDESCKKLGTSDSFFALPVGKFETGTDPAVEESSIDKQKLTITSSPGAIIISSSNKAKLIYKNLKKFP